MKPEGLLGPQRIPYGHWQSAWLGQEPPGTTIPFWGPQSRRAPFLAERGRDSEGGREGARDNPAASSGSGAARRLTPSTSVDRDGPCEPATLIAVVWLTAIGIKALAQWVMKQQSRGELELRLETVSPDHTRTTKVVKLRHEESGPPSTETIKELAAAIDVDPARLSTMLAGEST